MSLLGQKFLENPYCHLCSLKNDGRPKSGIKEKTVKHSPVLNQEKKIRQAVVDMRNAISNT